MLLSISLLYVSASVVLLFTLAVLHRIWHKRSLRHIPGPPSVSIFSGNLTQWFGSDAVPFHEYVYQKYGRIFKLDGFLGDKLLSIADTKALHYVLVKHQDIFEEADFFMEPRRLILGPGLSGTMGETHRKQRKLMTPAFSINHMRRIIPIFQKVTLQLQGILRADLGGEVKEINVLEYLSKLALELIAQAGMGYSFNALVGENNGYSLALKGIFPNFGKVGEWMTVLPILTRYFPPRLLRALADITPWTPLKELVSTADTMHHNATSIWENKKVLHARGDKNVVNEYGEGKDVMSILLKSNLEAAEERLPDDQLLAQINVFLLAGSDTTSTAISRILYLLALHSDAQDKLRKELTEAGGAKGELRHDELIALPYLEAVVRESLRLHPPVHFVQRQSRKDFVLPLSRSFTDARGKEQTELIVPSNTTIFINILAVNRDKDIWGPDVLEWKPERWLNPLPESVIDARMPGVYANTMTFIGGGRSCIGFKFTQLEIKVVLSQLIPSFRFTPSDKELVWNWGPLTTPNVKGSPPSKPQLPLRVSTIQK